MSCRSARRFFIEQKTPKRGVFFACRGKDTFASVNTAVPPMQGTAVATLQSWLGI
jgi:hypothetical protein